MKPPLMHGRPDDFQTPKQALIPLYKYLNPDWKIWEPACGNGNLVNGLQDNGFEVISSDINQGIDFLQYTPDDEWNCIITNPPFSLKNQFISRCYSLGKPWALLMPLTTFEGQKRQEMFSRFGIQVLFFNKRINFETPSGKGSGSWFMSAWFTWGLGLPPISFFQYGKQEELF